VICANKIKVAGVGIPLARIVCGRRVSSGAHEEADVHVTVKLYATLHRYGRGERAGIPFRIELSHDATLRDLLYLLKIPPGETRITFVNGIIEGEDCRLKEGDVVGMFPPIGGG
jgi:sulfur-carrier protein